MAKKEPKKIVYLRSAKQAAQAERAGGSIIKPYVFGLSLKNGRGKRMRLMSQIVLIFVNAWSRDRFKELKMKKFKVRMECLVEFVAEGESIEDVKERVCDLNQDELDRLEKSVMEIYDVFEVEPVL